MPKVLLALLTGALLVCGSTPAQRSAFVVEQLAVGKSLVVEHFRVPAGGYSLATTVVRPRGKGPYPVIVLNHGVGFDAAARWRESPLLLLPAAEALASRGYAVAMPLRRGFGATGGEFAEDPGSCSHPDFQRAERAAAADVLAAYDFARTLPYADPQRMILAGQSAGGVVSLYAATYSPPGLRAVLAFAAGRGADPLHPGVPCAPGGVAAVFEQMGRAVKVPVLLCYTQNDLFFGPAIARSWYGRFEAAGGRADFRLEPAFRANGHYLFSDPAGVRVWMPVVLDFLRRHHIALPIAKQRT
ncbi:MAG TPA: CocE/NonD family hydrolase [Burkholderiales bacterium]|nr:CocE/NonD family hydrolase [Burkholderiales bacterium]